MKFTICFNLTNTSEPLILGIISSNKIKSYVVFLTFSKQSIPLSDNSSIGLYFSNTLVATFKFNLLSSTTNILLFDKSKSTVVSTTFCSTTSLLIFWSIATVNLEPFPYVECTTILPPIKSINCLVIASPSPVPSIVVFLSSSSLWNLVNNLFISSVLIPLPESSTLTINLQILLFLTHLTLKSTYPVSVYLIAFVSKLTIIFFKLAWSPYNVDGISGAIFIL